MRKISEHQEGEKPMEEEIKEEVSKEVEEVVKTDLTIQEVFNLVKFHQEKANFWLSQISY